MANDATTNAPVTGQTPADLKPKVHDMNYSMTGGVQSAFNSGKGEAKAAGNTKS